MYVDDMRVFRVDDGETHWVVAEDADEAIRETAETFDYTVDDYREEFEPACEPVFHSDAITVDSRPDGERVTKSAREWAIEKRGVFCSTTWP